MAETLVKGAFGAAPVGWSPCGLSQPPASGAAPSVHHQGAGAAAVGGTGRAGAEGRVDGSWVVGLVE